MKSVFRLDAETTSEELERTWSLPQDDPAALMLFNLIFDTLVVRVTGLANNKVQDGTWVNIIRFADKYWLVATDPQMLG